MYDHNLPDTLQELAPTELYPVEYRSPGIIIPPRKTAEEGAQIQNVTDPMAELILDVAYRLLSDKEQITVKDFLDEETLQIGESALRERLNRLVETSKLQYLPGSGRRPNYYYLPGRTSPLPPEEMPNSSLLTDEETLEQVKCEEVNLRVQVEAMQVELDSLVQDRMALERTISIKKRYMQYQSSPHREPQT